MGFMKSKDTHEKIRVAATKACAKFSNTQQKKEGKQQKCSDEKTRVSWTYLYAIWSYVRVDQATIPHLKEDIQGYLLIIDQDCSLTDKDFLNVFLSRAWVYHVCS